MIQINFLHGKNSVLLIKLVKEVLSEGKLNYVEISGEAAFYGPKIDVQVWSSIGKEFTLATNQVDFAIPSKFGLVYKDENDCNTTPLCIHRAPLGTHERFIGCFSIAL